MLVVLEGLVRYCGVNDCYTVKIMVIGQTHCFNTGSALPMMRMTFMTMKRLMSWMMTMKVLTQ